MTTGYSAEARDCIFCVVQISKVILNHLMLKHADLKTKIIYSKTNLFSGVKTLTTKLLF